jgi:hypothetical protein
MPTLTQGGNETNRAGREHINARRVAHDERGIDFRFDCLSRLPGALQRHARVFERLIAVTSERYRAANADGQFLLVNEPAERDCAVYRSPRRVKEDWRLPALHFHQQLAELLRGFSVDLAFCGDPLVTACPARIRIAVGQIKFNRDRRRLVTYCRRRRRSFGKVAAGTTTPRPITQASTTRTIDSGREHGMARDMLQAGRHW